MRSSTWILLAILASLTARAEAPHSTTVAPGATTDATPANSATAPQSYPAFEPGTEAEEISSAPAVDVNNQPPRFLYSASPAILIPIDGQPVLQDSGAADLDRVINTRAPIFQSRRDHRYHVRLGSSWYATRSLDSDWALESPSAGLAARLEQARKNAGTQVDELTAPSSSPRIFTSTAPAELIQTNGNAALSPIGNGRLLYVTNTPNDLFFHAGDQQYYVLASGRWYRSASLQGTWVYVSGSALPPEFAQIPVTHPKASVLASIPGTAPAAAAVASASVPQVATIDRSTPATAVRYDGAPDFVPIPGTALYYARNSSDPVLEVSPGRFMTVENGVWFEGPTSLGPWTVATSVPTAVYSIPPSSPVYYVRYVYVYGYGPGWVRVGYLPGYLGSYVTPDGVVVYGTGYHYRPWLGHVWYGYPATYGFGVSWGTGHAWVFGSTGYHPYRPYWGPWGWEHYHHVTYAPGPAYIGRHDFYRDWGSHATPYHYVSRTPPGWSSAPPGGAPAPHGWSHYSPAPPAHPAPGGWSHAAPPSPTTHPAPGGWSHYASPAPTHSAPAPSAHPVIPHTAAPAPYHGPSPFARPASPYVPPAGAPAPSSPHFSAVPAPHRFMGPSPRADLRGGYAHGGSERVRR